MSLDLSFSEMLDQLQAGNQAAAAEVFRRYAVRLAALVRGRLDGRLGGAVSASDVVQEALKSFFRQQRERPLDIDGEDALWGLLARMTLYKCGKMKRALLARKRGGGQVRHLQPEDGSAGGWDVVDEEPTPAEAAVLEDLVEKLLAGLKEDERAIFTLRRQGFAVNEIAPLVDLTETTVSRKLGKIKDRLLQMMDQEQRP